MALPQIRFGGALEAVAASGIYGVSSEKDLVLLEPTLMMEAGMEARMEGYKDNRNKMIQPARLLTIEELAQFLQVKKSWLYGQTRVASRTGFPVVRCGKYVRFKLDDVLEWLNNGSKMVAR